MSRPEPQIVRIVPPDRTPYSGGFLLLMGVGAVTQLLLLLQYAVWFNFNMIVHLAACVVFACVIVSFARANRRYAARRAKIDAEWHGGDIDAKTCGLDDVWKRNLRGLDMPMLRQRLDQAEWLDRSRANVLTLGVEPACPPGDYRFEPEIVTPGDRYGAWLYPVASIGAPAAGYFLLDAYGVWPQARLQLWLLAAGVGVFAALSAWKMLARPTYLRIAPGILQTLRFDVWRRKPTIRNYPIDAGTVIILHTVPMAPDQAVLHLDRDGRTERFWAANRERNARMVERVWQAIMTTAPTPPLSEEELVG